MTQKVALITGGTSGIGLAVTKALAERGDWSIHVLGQNEARGAEAEKLPRTTFHRANVTVYDELAAVFHKVFSETGRLDYVFANAGIFERTPFYEPHSDATNGPPRLDLTALDSNLTGVVMTGYLAQHYFRISPHRGQGASILLNSSTGGIYPAYNLPIYSATKHGIIGFMRAISKQFYSNGIRANAICPGIVRTNLVADAIWDSFPTHLLIPMEDVLNVILMLLDGEQKNSEIVDGSGTRVSASQLYGRTVEVSNSHFYFREQPEYSDEGMKELMTFEG
ncbi:hypothetical protein NUU61_009578 [Penicillium alfredii]|uniref:NAD(P)-binding protein n=1 Tax=Penicillium alfredii TaxID=1506179 RepID=A0A9W9JT88_9EURO|nr:uncharacterized protein NUU61_009578 [Penicillium alfredii]KAJ5081314.1 hypothetical protein NUU61_009578 [Penicillium alfredii]